MFDIAPVKIRKNFFAIVLVAFYTHILDSNSEIMLKFFFVAFWSWKQIVARINFSLSESSNLNPVPEHKYCWAAVLVLGFSKVLKGLAASMFPWAPLPRTQLC
jgi:hypothetical protein